MIEPGIRLAEPRDRDALIWLEETARHALVSQRGGDLWLERHPAQSPAWPAVDTDDVIVSTIDDVVVGYLRLTVTGHVVVVEDVFVHQGAREVGCGDALLERAVSLGVERGARRIEAEALPGDRETKNLYERAGITAKRITLASPIGPDGVGG